MGHAEKVTASLQKSISSHDVLTMKYACEHGRTFQANVVRAVAAEGTQRRPIALRLAYACSSCVVDYFRTLFQTHTSAHTRKSNSLRVFHPRVWKHRPWHPPCGAWTTGAKTEAMPLRRLFRSVISGTPLSFGGMSKRTAGVRQRWKRV